MALVLDRSSVTFPRWTVRSAIVPFKLSRSAISIGTVTFSTSTAVLLFPSSCPCVNNVVVSSVSDWALVLAVVSAWLSSSGRKVVIIALPSALLTLRVVSLTVSDGTGK